MIGKGQKFFIVTLYLIGFILISIDLRDSPMFIPFMFIGITLAHAVKKHFFTNQR